MPHHSDDEELLDEEPPACEPYTVLGIGKTATPDDIKSAYRKAALKHHPDKASPSQKDAATIKFQEIAFAYAILSDPIRRSRYDTTGSTTESLDADEDFSWSDFYRSQFADVITSDSIEKFSKQYKGSDEEKDDVLAAYETHKGKWNGIYDVVMLSNCLEDEDRYKAWIDEAIKGDEVEAFKAYTGETEAQKEKRMKKARIVKDREGGEAMELAEKLGVKEKLFGGGKGGHKSKGESALAALIQKNQAGRNSFLDQLEQKYCGKENKTKKGKKRGIEAPEDDMPSEEAFQATAVRLKGSKNGGETKAKRTKR